MNLFKRFLNPKARAEQDQDTPEKADRGKYMPEVKLPTDERFMLNFKNNGGKFLYCIDEAEVQEPTTESTEELMSIPQPLSFTGELDTADINSAIQIDSGIGEYFVDRGVINYALGKKAANYYPADPNISRLYLDRSTADFESAVSLGEFNILINLHSEVQVKIKIKVIAADTVQ